MNIEEAMSLFANHPPSADTRARRERCRQAAREFANIVLREAPEAAPETDLAVRKIEEALMWANKSIGLPRQETML